MTNTALLGTKLRIAGRYLKYGMDRKLESLDLTAIQSFILRYISESNQSYIYPKDIESRFFLTHPTVSGILQRMETKGFIHITEDPSDHRRHQISLTDKAICCDAQIRDYVDSMEHNMLSGFTDDESKMLLNYLDRISDNLKNVFTEEESVEI